MQRLESVAVRPAGIADAAEIVSLARELARQVEDPDPGEDGAPLIAAIFSPHPWGECLVADGGGTVVGFVLFCRRFEVHTGLKSVWISDLAVGSNRRGQGIGDLLLGAVRNRAQELGAVSIFFEVWKENAGALRFYAKAGATVLKDRDLLRL